MYKLFALWGEPKDVEGFEEHYRKVHLPLASAVPGIRRLVLTRTGDGLGENPSAHYRVAELVWDSKDALDRCQQSAEWQALVADAGDMVERFDATLANAGGDEVDEPLAG